MKTRNLSDEQMLMIHGMFKLYRKFNKYSNDKEFTVLEMIEAYNETCDEIMEMSYDEIMQSLYPV